jgi:hypothetical protein
MRKPGWQRALNEFLIRWERVYKERGLVPGETDCAHFAGDWVLELTGADPLTGYRGAYATKEAGDALLVEIDGSLLQALEKRFGAPVHPSKALRGDIAFKADVGIGIYFTSGARMFALFLGEGGFIMHRAADTDHAFAVR